MQIVKILNLTKFQILMNLILSKTTEALSTWLSPKIILVPNPKKVLNLLNLDQIWQFQQFLCASSKLVYFPFQTFFCPSLQILILVLPHALTIISLGFKHSKASSVDNIVDLVFALIHQLVAKEVFFSCKCLHITQFVIA